MSILKNIIIDIEAIQLLSTQQAWYYEVVPNKTGELQTSFYIAEGKDFAQTKNELEILTGKEIELEIVDKSLITKALLKYYPNKGKLSHNISSNQDFLEKIIEDARINESSDIHFETYEDKCRVRIRIDGRLVEKYIIPPKEYKTIINKVKIQANLDIAEKRLPQDGRILYNKGATILT